MKKYKIILVLTTITLFAFSMLKTYDLLGLSSSSQEEKEISDNSSGEKERHISNSSNPNFYQLEDDGQTMFDGKYIYYNGNGYVIKYDIDKKTEEPIIAGRQMKCITDAYDYIFGVTTIQNGNNEDKDYVIKVSKTSGDSNIFYKTENNHITSMVFDGEYIYYTNESHSIFRLGEEPEIWVNAKNKADFPIIIGIYNKNMYICDGTQIESINIENLKKSVIYTGVSSYNQLPIMSDKYIFITSDFTKKDIVRIDLDTLETKNILDKSFAKAIGKSIDSFSITENNLYINFNGSVYIKDQNTENHPILFKDIDSTWSCSCNQNIIYYVKDGKLIIETKK